MAEHQFCREVALERDEPLAGTGTLAKRLILLRWPRGAWRVPRYQSAGMGPALAAAIETAMEAGTHVALVDRPGAFDSLPQLQAGGVAASFASEAELAGAVLRLWRGEVLEGEPDERTVVLCCTDSRRDACCARYGFATFKALAAAADPAKVNLLQATHLGGCRFAASLVVLPKRHRYGRLAPAEAPDFLAAIGRGEIYLPAFRGRPDRPEPAQVAEVAALNWAAERGIGQDQVAFEPVSWPEGAEEGTVLTVTARAARQPLALTLRAETLPMSGNCELLASAAAKPTMRWRILSVEAQ